MTATPYNRGNQPTTRALGFLLLDHFTMISLASAIEPLRMANQLSGKELYRWHTLSLDGKAVSASDGIQVNPDASIQDHPSHDQGSGDRHADQPEQNGAMCRRRRPC